MRTELSVPDGVDVMHRAATTDVNRWRGHCIELFARAEQELARALEGRIAGRTPTSIAGRIDALKTAQIPAKLRKTLDALRDLSEHRNLIVHARSTVWINERGSWLWAYNFRPAGKDKTEQVGRWVQTEAEPYERDLARTVQSFSSQLTRLPSA